MQQKKKGGRGEGGRERMFKRKYFLLIYVYIFNIYIYILSVHVLMHVKQIYDFVFQKSYSKCIANALEIDL